MTIFQLVAILFGLFMLYAISIHGKKKTLTLMEVSFWTSLWLIFIVLALFPSLLLGIADALKFSRVFDLLIVIAFMILSLLLFLSYFRQKETAQKVEKLVREMALYKQSTSQAEETASQGKTGSKRK